MLKVIGKQRRFSHVSQDIHFAMPRKFNDILNFVGFVTDVEIYPSDNKRDKYNHIRLYRNIKKIHVGVPNTTCILNTYART